MSAPDSAAPEGVDAAVDVARDYYNSSDADHFYFHVWGAKTSTSGFTAMTAKPSPRPVAAPWSVWLNA